MPTPSLSTSARGEYSWPHHLYGTPVTVVEDPHTHTHTWHAWQPRPGSGVHGSYCFGCDILMVD